MEKTYIVEKYLFDDILDDVFMYLAEKSGEEIPDWGSYDVDTIEKIYPIRRYHVTLHEGPVERPGEVVATVLILVDIADGEDKAEVFVKWDE